MRKLIISLTACTFAVMGSLAALDVQPSPASPTHPTTRPNMGPPENLDGTWNKSAATQFDSFGRPSDLNLNPAKRSVPDGGKFQYPEGSRQLMNPDGTKRTGVE